jgi:hypothetical protein
MDGGIEAWLYEVFAGARQMHNNQSKKALQRFILK